MIFSLSEYKFPSDPAPASKQQSWSSRHPQLNTNRFAIGGLVFQNYPFIMNSRVPSVMLEHWRKDAIIIFLTLNVIGLIGFITFTQNQSQSTWQEPYGERNPFAC
jgi:hypothetical protein